MTRDEALETLGLSGNPSPEEIQRAYGECAKKFHPDLYATQPEPVRQVMNEKMRRVNEARELLLERAPSRPDAPSPAESSRSAEGHPATATIGALLAQKKFDEALRISDQALLHIGHLPDLLVLKAWALALLGRGLEVPLPISEALQIAPDEPDIVIGAGMASFAAGYRQEALSLLERGRAVLGVEIPAAMAVEALCLTRAGRGHAAGPLADRVRHEFPASEHLRAIAIDADPQLKIDLEHREEPVTSKGGRANQGFGCGWWALGILAVITSIAGFGFPPLFVVAAVLLGVVGSRMVASVLGKAKREGTLDLLPGTAEFSDRIRRSRSSTIRCGACRNAFSFWPEAGLNTVRSAADPNGFVAVCPTTACRAENVIPPLAASKLPRFLSDDGRCPSCRGGSYRSADPHFDLRVGFLPKCPRCGYMEGLAPRRVATEAATAGEALPADMCEWTSPDGSRCTNTISSDLESYCKQHLQQGTDREMDKGGGCAVWLVILGGAVAGAVMGGPLGFFVGGVLGFAAALLGWLAIAKARKAARPARPRRVHAQETPVKGSPRRNRR